MEFEESNDQRSGRPLAICVVRLDLSEQASTEPNMEQTSTESVLVSSNRISGTVVKEAKVYKNQYYHINFFTFFHVMCGALIFIIKCSVYLTEKL